MTHRKPLLFLPLPALLVAALLLRPTATPSAASAPPREPDRSPTDLALTANGRHALTANHTANTVSLVDVVKGSVLAETAVGQRPFAVILLPGGRALVSNERGDSVSLLEVKPASLKLLRTMTVGDEPRGIAVSPDGTRAFVALAGEEAVAVIDTLTLQVVSRWRAGQEPWHLALTPNGKRLAVGNTRGRDVWVLDTATGQKAHVVRVLGRNLRHLAVSPDGKWAYVPNISERGLATTRENIDRGWVVGNRLARVPLDEAGPREALTLDTQGRAVGDVDGVAVSPDGRTLALTAGGTHELLLLRLRDLPFIAYGGPGDHIDPDLLREAGRFRRVPLGGRPLGIRWAPDNKHVIAANYLHNSIQVVDVALGTVTKTIALGGPATPSLARQGEAIFLDAGRSFNQWYSCNTCHVGGHTNGGSFDTFNDGSYGMPKKTLSLRGVAQTAPYTWHGWQKTLDAALRESLVKSMQGPEPSRADVQALGAYVKTLDWPSSPNRNENGTLSARAKRGETIFQAKACTSCHAGPNFTFPTAFAVGLEGPDDAFKGFNPPPLRNVYNRAPFLHDGRAQTLEEVLTEHHRPSQLTGKPDLTPKELVDLVAYLKSL